MIRPFNKYLLKRPKLLDKATYENTLCSKLLEEKRKHGKERALRNFLHSFHHYELKPIIQQYYNLKKIGKFNPKLKQELKEIFSIFHEELVMMRPVIDIKYVADRNWDYEVKCRIDDMNLPQQIEQLALKKIQTMSQQEIRSLLADAINQVVDDLEITYQNKLAELGQTQRNTLERVRNLQTDAKEIANHTAQNVLEQERETLVQQLYPADNDFLRKDKTRAFYYENIRKEKSLLDTAEQLKQREQELAFRGRETSLTQREKELTLRVIEKDIQIEKKMLALVQSMNLQELNQKELDVAYRLLQVQREGISNREKLVRTEEALLKVSHVRHQNQVRDIMFDVQQQKFEVQKLNAAIDIKRRDIDVRTMRLNANNEIAELEEHRQELLLTIRRHNQSLIHSKNNGGLIY